MAEWRTIDSLSLSWKDGRTVRVRLSRLENQRELKAFWQDCGEMAGNWFAENEQGVIRPQLYFDFCEEK